MTIHHPAQNHLLAALPAAEFDRLQPDLEVVPMPPGRRVHDAGSRPEYAYFPTSCIVTLQGTDGAASVAAMVGGEGMVGYAGSMGATTASAAVVQQPGYAYRLNAEVLARDFRQGSTLGRLALAFRQALVAQVSHTAACRRHHPIEQQWCRWLLMGLDRSAGAALAATLDSMERVLDAPRDRIVHALARLQARGLVDSRRGAIEVVDREALEDTACECYGATLREYARILGAPSRGGVVSRRPLRRTMPAEAAGLALS